MNSNKILWSFFMLVIFFACKSKKNFSAPVQVITNIDSSNKEEIITADKLLSNTLKDWTYFSSKASIEYINGNDNHQAGSNIRMYKDSLIWVSINVFGIEGGRLLINKDSMVMYDKVNKNYRVYKKEWIESILGAPLTVNEIQNILLAQPIYSLKLYEIFANDNSILKIKNVQPSVFIHHSYLKEFYTIDTTLIEDRTAPHFARINYSNYKNISLHNFPLKNKIYAFNGKSVVQINMEFEDPDFENPVTFPFTIPSSYERIK